MKVRVRNTRRRVSSVICRCPREHNIQVCVPTTPAQMFHMLRRQVIRPLRKPLIAFTPKTLLRHKLAISTLEDLAERYVPAVMAEIDPIETRERVARVVLCSGKVYYDLLERRRDDHVEDMAIVRLEQLYPFPEEELARRSGALHEPQGRRVVSGRADEPGCVVLPASTTCVA